MTDRVTDGLCLMCELPLIVDNEYHCCTACTNKLKKAQAQLRGGQKISSKEPLHINLSGGASAKIGARFRKL